MTKQLRALLESGRPKQWLKNTFLFAGAVFAERLWVAGILPRLLAGFFLFSLAASAVYLFNDFMDVEQDSLHPQKSKRPLPSGRLNRRTALSSAIITAAFAVPLSFYLASAFGLWVLTYVVINVLYSVKLKRIVILDVMTIAAGFVIRVMAGCSLVAVTPSDWLVVCTITISLFLGSCKRRQELVLVSNTAGMSREVIKHYDIRFLDQMIGVATSATLISYILYTLSPETVAKLGTRNLVLTLPFVLYGTFRYLYVIYQKQGKGDPTDTLLSDRPLLINTFLWGIAVLVIIYGR
jgi:4-hydroxybenzoate polyprenyltransferase